MPAPDPKFRHRLLKMYKAAYGHLPGRESCFASKRLLFPVDQDISASATAGADFATILQAILREWKFFETSTSNGLRVFSDVFDSLPVDLDELRTHIISPLPETDEIKLILMATSAFAQRVSATAHGIDILCATAAANTLTSDSDRLVESLARWVEQEEEEQKPGDNKGGSKIRTSNHGTPRRHEIVPTDIRTSTAESRPPLTPFRTNSWAKMEYSTRNRVGFKSTAAVITEEKVEEEALRVTAFRRRRQRNPTGFLKFHFKDLGLENDADLDSDEAGEGQSRAGSFVHERGTTASGSVTSSSEDDVRSRELRRKSSGGVSFSSDKEREIIEDVDADPEWDNQHRHQVRVVRIRHRIPTAHPVSSIAAAAAKANRCASDRDGEQSVVAAEERQSESV